MDFKSKQQTIENVHFSLDKKTIVNIIYVETGTGGNIMTISEIKNMFKDQYADVEYYRKHV